MIFVLIVINNTYGSLASQCFNRYHFQFRGGGGSQNLRGRNMLPGYICMEKIVFLWSDCMKVGGEGGRASASPLPPTPAVVGKMQHKLN